jgi:hypothetical protein
MTSYTPSVIDLNDYRLLASLLPEDSALVELVLRDYPEAAVADVIEELGWDIGTTAFW